MQLIKLQLKNVLFHHTRLIYLRQIVFIFLILKCKEINGNFQALDMQGYLELLSF